MTSGREVQRTDNLPVEIVTDIPAIADDNLLAIAETAEKRVLAMQRIKSAALKVTNKQDWIDLAGKPYLQAAGAEKVARLFGISWIIMDPEIIEKPDEHKTFIFKGTFMLSGSSIQAEGSRSSDEKFFCTRKEGSLNAADVDMTNVRQAALTSCLNNGIKRLLGLRNLTWDEVRDPTNIKKTDVGGTDYSGKTEEEKLSTQEQRDGIKKLILEMAGGDLSDAKTILEKASSFQGDKGLVPGKTSVDQLSDKAVPVVYGKVKRAYDIWTEQSQDDGDQS